MKITVARDVMIPALNFVCSAIERTQVNPILNNVLANVHDGILDLTGSNLSVFLHSTIDEINIEKEGVYALPAQKLLSIFNSFSPGSNVVIEASTSSMTVQSGRSRFKLATMSADDYPNEEIRDVSVQTNINSKELADMISRTEIVMGVSDARYYLNGMLFEIASNHFRSVASDGSRMAVFTNPEYGSSSLDAPEQAIIPRRTIADFSKMLSLSGDEISISFSRPEGASSNSQISASSSKYSLSSTLIDAEYPKYSLVIPDDTENILRSDSQDLRSICRRATIVASDLDRRITMNLQRDSLKITSNNDLGDTAEIEAAVDFNQDKFEISFNGDLIVEILDRLKSDTVKITLTDSDTPMKIEGDDEVDLIYILSPMRK